MWWLYVYVHAPANAPYIKVHILPRKNTLKTQTNLSLSHKNMRIVTPKNKTKPNIYSLWFGLTNTQPSSNENTYMWYIRKANNKVEQIQTEKRKHQYAKIQMKWSKTSGVNRLYERTKRMNHREWKRGRGTEGQREKEHHYRTAEEVKKIQKTSLSEKMCICVLAEHSLAFGCANIERTKDKKHFQKQNKFRKKKHRKKNARFKIERLKRMSQDKNECRIFIYFKINIIDPGPNDKLNSSYSINDIAKNGWVSERERKNGIYFC